MFVIVVKMCVFLILIGFINLYKPNLCVAAIRAASHYLGFMSEQE